MADMKTVPTKVSVDTFLKGIKDEKKRADCYQILEIMKKATKSEPKMWGTSIVGFQQFPDLMEKLGKRATGKGCLYINKLEDVDTKVLKDLITHSVKAAKSSKG